MGLFGGGDARLIAHLERENARLHDRVRELEQQLLAITRPTAHAALNPKPAEPTPKPVNPLPSAAQKRADTYIPRLSAEDIEDYFAAEQGGGLNGTREQDVAELYRRIRDQGGDLGPEVEPVVPEPR
jgi:hypothetical protein